MGIYITAVNVGTTISLEGSNWAVFLFLTALRWRCNSYLVLTSLVLEGNLEQVTLADNSSLVWFPFRKDTCFPYLSYLRVYRRYKGTIQSRTIINGIFRKFLKTAGFYTPYRLFSEYTNNTDIYRTYGVLHGTYVYFGNIPNIAHIPEYYGISVQFRN